MLVQPYLFFEGRCEEALNFYRSALGAEIGMLLRFKDSPDPSMAQEGMGEKILHSSFKVGETTLNASDGKCQSTAKFEGFSLSITVSDVKKAEEVFAALAEGGEVQMPLTQTFFSPKFGMVADRFGVSWMILVAQ